MELILLSGVGIASFVVLIAVLILCAKKQSFTIQHFSYERAQSPAERGAYYSRHQFTVTENTQSRLHRRDETDGVATHDTSKDRTDFTIHNDTTLEITKKTADTQVNKRQDCTGKGNAIKFTSNKEEVPKKEVQRVSSKRRAPATPNGITTRSGVEKMTASSHGPAAAKTSTDPQSSVPIHPHVIHSESLDRISVSTEELSLTKETNQFKDIATEVTVKEVSVMNSVPRRDKSTPATFERPRGKKLAPSPPTSSRPSSKRHAPAVPEQLQEVRTGTHDQPSNATLISLSGAPQEKETHATSNDHMQEVSNKEPDAVDRISRHVLDRLPSVPEPFENKVVEKNERHEVPYGLDGTDGGLVTEVVGSQEEDHYSVIKKFRSSEDGNCSGGSGIGNPNLDLNTVMNNGLQIEGDANADLAQTGSVIHDIELITDEPFVVDTKDKDRLSKVEPPYAKVIKKNRRNRANIRVHFNPTDNTDGEKEPHLPTPGAFVFEASIGSEGLRKDSTRGEDNVLLIPEGPDYI